MSLICVQIIDLSGGLGGWQVSASGATATVLRPASAAWRSQSFTVLDIVGTVCGAEVCGAPANVWAGSN